VGSRSRLAAVLLTAGLASFALGGGAGLTLALMTDAESAASTFSTAAVFDSSPPTVSSSVIARTTAYLAGAIKQGGQYYVYANVSDAGGVASVTADVSNVTTGQTALALVAGSYTAEGVSYGYRSAAAAADAVLSAGSKSYTISAIDTSANSTTQGGFSVTVDNTAPAGSDAQTANGSSTVGKAQLDDIVTFTFSELIDPESILAGWDGSATSVVVRITNNSSLDLLTVWDAGNSAQLPLGSLNLSGNYVNGNRNFGASGTASTMVLSGSTITVTLGTASGSTNTVGTAAIMIWTPSAMATDAAGNACTTTVVVEGGAFDVEY